MTQPTTQKAHRSPFPAWAKAPATAPVIVAPSLLAADFANLQSELASIETAPWVHLDVMDGRFVPNISFGMPVIKALRPHSKAFFDAHLMVEDADPHLKAVADAGADQITVHVEGNWHLNRTLQVIKELGCRAGVALCPATPVEALSEIMGMVDSILVMTVNPGFGGQKFMPAQLPKIRRIARMAAQQKAADGHEVIVGVDGGVNPATTALVTDAGARMLVAGSAVFGHPDRAAAINALEGAAMPPVLD
ncbi:ribulose-phosphate 3-epimerase [Formicincola oecophyllae]|uniref:Ribulose-phosphate 3-epimerase n=1 Tax=Formicincola oecophyllae TaxID=2558361 RepID=A0A4Y6UAI6_9PROT|nr:ribulose-phosphate 3-epimerase [Formicincola oecophyllae]QDH13457.1 ribulose-phosphate 3-epimerase [Formicincola oecophyllae]